MTQAPLLSIVSAYAIDASSIMELDNAHIVLEGMPVRASSFTATQRESIWSGLQEIAQDARLKLLDKIQEDLERRYPECLPRLLSFPHIRLRTTRAIDLTYQQIVGKHERLMAQILKFGFRDADPYLVAAAKVRNLVVISEELDNQTRRRKSKDVPIPDICTGENVLCRRLRQVAQDEGWI